MGRSTRHLAGGATHAGLLCPGTSLLTCSLPQHRTPVVRSIWTVTPDLVQVNTHTPKHSCSVVNSVSTQFVTFWYNYSSPCVREVPLNINRTLFAFVCLHSVTWHSLIHSLCYCGLCVSTPNSDIPLPAIHSCTPCFILFFTFLIEIMSEFKIWS